MEQLAEFDSILESKFKTEVFDTYPVDDVSEVIYDFVCKYISSMALKPIHFHCIRTSFNPYWKIMHHKYKL